MCDGGLRGVLRKLLPNSCNTVIEVGRESILRSLWLCNFRLHGAHGEDDEMIDRLVALSVTMGGQSGPHAC